MGGRTPAEWCSRCAASSLFPDSASLRRISDVRSALHPKRGRRRPLAAISQGKRSLRRHPMGSSQRSRIRTALALPVFAAIVTAPAAGFAQPPATAVPQETQDTTKLAAPLRAARAEMTAAYVALNATAAGRFFADSAVVNFQGEVL